jgi:asparagine N-glycosylation enzyme membrane subunit Stt3
LFLSVLHTLQQFITAQVQKFTRPAEKIEMLWTIAVLLLILWLLGMVSSYTLGGFIHILLILAVVAILIRIIQGRSPV